MEFRQKNNKGYSIFKIQYNEKFIELIKNIKHYNYEVKNKQWRVEVIYENHTKIIQLCNIFNFNICEEFLLYCHNLKQKYKEQQERYKENITLSNQISTNVDIKVDGLKGELREFQKVGVEFGIKNKRVIIGDEMGLGKSLEALSIIECLELKRTLILCPNTLKNNWEDEINKWFDKQILIFDSNSKIDILSQSYNYLIMSYNTLIKFEKIIEKIEFDAIILDEGHFLKNKESRRTKGVLKIRNKFNVRILLTGTLSENSPCDVVTQLDIIGKMEEFGGWWSFVKKYCRVNKTSFGLQYKEAKIEMLPHLHSELRKICYIRREKRDVLKELPDKQRTIIKLDIDNRKEYEKARFDLIKYLKTLSNENLLNYSHLELTDEEEIEEFRTIKVGNAERAEHLVKINLLKQLIINGKLKGIIEWIEGFLEINEKLVIFANHTKIINYLCQYFKCNQISGQVPDRNVRHEIVRDFMDNPHSHIIIINSKAGAGLNGLTVSSNVLTLELGWTSTGHDQNEDRCHRLGQKNMVNCWYLLGKDTIEMDIWDLIERKRVITDAINKGTIPSSGDIDVMKELIKILKN